MLFAIAVLASCKMDTDDSGPKQKNDSYPVTLKNLTDKEYPDNPDIGFRSERHAIVGHYVINIKQVQYIFGHHLIRNEHVGLFFIQKLYRVSGHVDNTTEENGYVEIVLFCQNNTFTFMINSWY